MRALGLFAVVVVIGCGSSQKDVAKPDPKLAELEQALAETKEQLREEREAADELRKSDAELKKKADEAAALQQKLADAVGKAGEVTTADGAVKLELVDQILFPTGEADLTDNGRAVLSKVGAALKDVDDKQIWVQGHTDDQPIMVRKKKPEPAAKPKELAKAQPKDKPGGKPPKGKAAEKPRPAASSDKPAEPDNDAVLPFVTNWELSAARALTVVHYLQDESKIDPTRLAAVAFGQYRPISKHRAKNRRIEIVLYPRAKIAK